MKFLKDKKIPFSFIISIIFVIVEYFYHYQNIKIIDFIPSTLWAEDGRVFLSEAFKFKIKSLLHIYSGYLHLYPRIFSFISSYCSLGFIPYIMFSGYFLAMVILIFSILKLFENYGYNIWEVFIISLVIFLRPHHIEAYLNITNAHWLLGSFLCIYLLNFTKKIYHMPFLAILFLTGPFCIFIIPFYFFYLFLNKQWKKEWWVFLLLFLSVCIQLYCIKTSARFSKPLPWDKNFHHWIIALKNTLFFGQYYQKHFIYMLIFSIFWITYLIYLFIFFWKLDKREKFFVFTLIVFGISILFSGIVLKVRNHPYICSPMHYFSRYYFILYLCVFLSMSILAKSGKYLRFINMLFFLMLIFIGMMYPHKYQKQNLSYRALAKISKYYRSIVIPINPVWKTTYWYFIYQNKKEIKKWINSPKIAKIKREKSGYYISIGDNASIVGIEVQNVTKKIEDFKVYIGTKVKGIFKSRRFFQTRVNPQNNKIVAVFNREKNDIFLFIPFLPSKSKVYLLQYKRELYKTLLKD